MRRLAKVFGPKKRDSAAESTLTASSSDGSATLVNTPAGKATWKSWLGKRSATALKPPASPQRPTLPKTWDTEPFVQPKNHVPMAVDDFTDEDGSEQSEDPVPLPQAASPSQAKTVLTALTQNSLARDEDPWASLPPFVLPTDSLRPIFPRSTSRPMAISNPISAAPSSIRVRLLKSRLLRSLETPVLEASSSSIEFAFSTAELENLARRPVPTTSAPASTPASASHTRDANAPYPPPTLPPIPYSLGIRRWIARPCFEDRYRVWTSDSSNYPSPVSAASLAVAALEYSEQLDVMADPDVFVYTTTGGDRDAAGQFDAWQGAEQTTPLDPAATPAHKVDSQQTHVNVSHAMDGGIDRDADAHPSPIHGMCLFWSPSFFFMSSRLVSRALRVGDLTVAPFCFCFGQSLCFLLLVFSPSSLDCANIGLQEYRHANLPIRLLVVRALAG